MMLLANLFLTYCRERESGGEGFLDVMVFSYNLSKFHIRMFAVESEL